MAGRRYERREQLGVLDRADRRPRGAVLYVLPTLIGVLRHVESLALVVILNLFPIAWPAALVAACMMPRKEGC
jgi:hypothetical protein